MSSPSPVLMRAHARRSDHVHNLASDASLQKLDGLDTSLFSRAPPEVRHPAPAPNPGLPQMPSPQKRSSHMHLPTWFVHQLYSPASYDSNPYFHVVVDPVVVCTQAV